MAENKEGAGPLSNLRSRNQPPGFSNRTVLFKLPNCCFHETIYNRRLFCQEFSLPLFTFAILAAVTFVAVSPAAPSKVTAYIRQTKSPKTTVYKQKFFWIHSKILKILTSFKKSNKKIKNEPMYIKFSQNLWLIGT